MNKYSLVFRTSFKQEKVTVFDTFLRAISFFLIVYILIQLWSYIYGEGGVNQVINGYSLEQMLWYLIATEAIQFSVSTSVIVKTVGKEIKTGSIAYKINKPYNFYLYNVTNFMAKGVWRGLFLIPESLLIGFAFVGAAPTFTVYQIIPCLLALLGSLLLLLSLHGIVGLISFWVEDAEPFNWIVIKLFMLFGLLFPLEFFPEVIQPIIMYSPIYSVFSGPAKLVASFSWDLFLKVFLSQVIWSSILLVIGVLVYRKGVKKVNVNGG